MAKVHSLRFESRLHASPELVWQWITSVRGITAEMSPWFRMTTPDHISSLDHLHFIPGEPLFSSRLLFLGFLPVDYSELTPGRGFVEQSPMGSMRQWRHVRRIEPNESGWVRLVDEISFEPRRASAVSKWFVQRFFQHRHRVLMRNFSDE